MTKFRLDVRLNSMDKRDFWITFLLGLFTFFLIAFTINQPGLTWDEANFIPSSLSYLDWFRQLRSADAFAPEVITRYWLPTREHPPLAKLLSGLTILLFHEIAGLIASARLSVALSFSLLLVLVYSLVRQFWSWKAGLFASLSLLIMPRLFGHAHLASLDVPMSLLSILVVFSFLQGINNWKWSLLLGLFFGLALATKVNALFLPFPLLIWAHLYHRRQYANNIMAMLFISPLVFIAIWPWLWVNIPQRLLEYLALKIQRSAIPVYYLGRTYGEVPPPWHYPFLMTAITIPSGLLITGLAGFIRAIKSSLKVPGIKTSSLLNSSASDHHKIGMLIIFNTLFPLLLISLPGVPKYDGVRLFLPAFPFLAMLSGLGLEWLAEKASSFFRKRLSLRRTIHLPLLLGLLFLGINTWPLVSIRPYYLSYYNSLVGGVRGARELGMETTYWGDTMTQTVLDYLNRQPPGTRVHFFPVGGNVVPLLKFTGRLREDLEVTSREEATLLVLNHRQGFFDEKIWRIHREEKPIKEASTFYRGVPLTAVYRLE
ncbi:glycosyltransferase family 39 protein [candidate division NPL-UPA2 bacterium]|nr:glycosyltransferase family 39 protein [candidate division NPL-UPA2 bacterium]